MSASNPNSFACCANTRRATSTPFGSPPIAAGHTAPSNSSNRPAYCARVVITLDYDRDTPNRMSLTRLEHLHCARSGPIRGDNGLIMRATICIPWRPSPSRIAAFDRVQAFWDQYFPGCMVSTADCDADTLIDPGNILAAVADPSGVWWPFEHYRIYGPKHLGTPLENLAATPHLN